MTAKEYLNQIRKLDKLIENKLSELEHWRIGSSGGFGYRTIKDTVDVTLVESVALAYWACHEDKPRRKQKISY